MGAAKLYAVGRLAYSAGLILAPAQVAGGWIGRDAAAGAGGQIGVRGLAGRDVSLAVGLLMADVRGRSPRPWLILCAIGDLADLTATLVAPAGDLPANARLGTIVLAGGSALVGGILALRN
ncbi:MAG: hypothetical protein QOH12_135 [Solirubrobacteraceae bacterium]|jgi:hypothetical protein|nr:hypothetical protein [Solirubrobacteraceae bacterium]